MPPEKLLSCPCYAICADGETPIAFGASAVFAWSQAEDCVGESALKLKELGYKLIEVQWSRTPSPELVELRRDKERLDWLENMPDKYEIGYPSSGDKNWDLFSDVDSEDIKAPTLRTAIDAAKEKKL